MMKKNLKQRLVSGLLTTVFAVSLLPMSAFAADPEPAKVAQVGEVQYANLAEAVEAASQLTDANERVVRLLAHIKAEHVDSTKTQEIETELQLGDVLLLVPADGEVNNTSDKTINMTGITLIGNRADYVLKNEGHLVLNEVTITNENKTSGMAVYNAPAEALPAQNVEQPEDATLTVNGGSFTGVYAMGVKQGTVGLNRYSAAAAAEGEEPVKGAVPTMEGTAADFLMEANGQIEVLTDLGKDTKYLVEAVAPGAVAHVAVDGQTVTGEPSWFVNTKVAGVQGISMFHEGVWTMATVIPEGAVTIAPVEFTYNEKSQMPAVTVKVGETTLTEKTDYEVSVEPKETVNVGKYTITVKGIGNYSGTHSVEFEIKAAVPEAITAAVELALPAEGYYTYTGKAVEPAVTVKNGETVIAPENYEVKYENNVNVGTAKVTVTPKEGAAVKIQQAEKTFEIKAQVVKPTVTVDASQGSFVYNGTAHTPAVTVMNGETLIAPENYEVKYENNINAGTATVKVTVKNTDTVTYEPAQQTFEIKAFAVKPTVTVDVPAEGMTHTGSALTPVVAVKIGERVIPAAEYNVAYTNNTDVGTATVTVTDKDGGNYVIEQTAVQFTIVAAEKLEPLQIGGKKDTVTYGDAAFKLTATGGKKDTPVTWTVAKGSATIDKDGLLTITGAGEITVTAVQSEELKDEWTFTAGKKELTVSGVTAADKTYDGKTTVSITAVELKGIVNSDDVKVNAEGLTGELSAAGVGVYDAVKPGNMSLTGAASGSYKLTVPTKPVAAKVTVKKADIPAALESIEVKLPVTTTKVEVPDLGAGMPKDAGTLEFLKNNQETETGNTVVVTAWGVDANGKLTSDIYVKDGGDKITYTVAVQSQNYNNALVKVIVSLEKKTAEAVDASKLTVTPASTTLTYNGADQKPAVTVKYNGTELKEGTDFDVTYPTDSKNVGDKEIKITFKGNYSGTAAAKYTISKAKITVSGGSVSDKTYDGGKSATVNLGTVSGIVKGDDVKVTAKGLFADANSGSGKKVSVTYTLSGNAAGNYELAATTATLTGRIYSISANSLYNRLGSLTTANANSSKAQTLKDVIYLSNLALGDGGMSGGERSSITALRDDAQNMQNRVASAAAAASTDSIKATEKVTKDNVKLTDQPALTKAQADLNAALTTYSGNYTTGEKKEIETDRTRVADALAVVTRVDSANKLITALPTDFTTVTTQTADAVNAANTAYSGLSDYGKSLIDKAQLEKLTAATKATEGVTPTEVPEDGVTNITGIDKNEGDKESPETIKFPTWIILVALVLAAAAGGGYYWYYKKQQEEEDEEAFFY